MAKIQSKNREIEIIGFTSANIDKQTVESFGEEWNSFHGFSDQEIQSAGVKYFDLLTPEMLNENSTIIDIGCGSGRYIKFLLSRYNFKSIVGIDPSSAIFAADALLGANDKVTLIQAAADNIPFPDNHFDFALSLGVFHHIPDTRRALNDSVKKLKSGGWFLLYLYYNLDNRNIIFKTIYYLSNLLRRVICKFPPGVKRIVCDTLAVLIYMPFVLFCRFLKVIGVPEKIRVRVPLQGYEDQSFYVIRNDSLDRFGTPLEQRFSRKEIKLMMEQAGLGNIVFSEKIPYWHAVGKKI